MTVQDVAAQARDAMTVKQVFGEPYEKDGVTVIPVARVQGGAGGGEGEGPEGQGKGYRGRVRDECEAGWSVPDPGR